MKRLTLIFLFFLSIISTTSFSVEAQSKSGILSGIGKLFQAVTLSDSQMAQYVGEYVRQTDSLSNVLPETDEKVVRLRRLTHGIDDVEGIPLNFQVYDVQDVNAFACPDGSVRIYAGLMNIMSDEEVLGVIGHEMGHVAHRDSKNAFKRALMTSALKDGISSVNGTVAALTNSQLSALGEALMTASYSQKQENAADDYGYEFLKSHNRNPSAMAKSFYKLKAIETAAGVTDTSKLNQLFSSHPKLESRIKRMEKRARSEGFWENQKNSQTIEDNKIQKTSSSFKFEKVTKKR